ncbi:UNVERIFIED_CONTAM: hypothetical protein Slati_4188800 [Sesamum latifolium]|uniref:Integrase zinc-binding domain-containing protein n=1 Tax=Sesamum latifolium TaxID=2727402 RepID=A0AAW2TA43_9LAMI
MKELQKKSSRHYRTQPEGGHSGINGTYQRIKPLFYWSTMKSDVQNLVKECEVCQRSKHENNPYSGLLHPLPIPEQAWSSISMDFIEGLPNSEGKDFILVGWTGLKATLFQALYGYPPHQLSIGPYLQNHHTEVEKLMQERIKVLQLLKDNLHQAQHRMKMYADKKRSEREFEVGDEVFLKLQPYGQTSIALRKQLKLSAKYFGPYRVIHRVGKKKVGSKYFPLVNLPEFEDEVFKVYPAAILTRRLISRNNVGVPQVLIQWSHSSPDQAT